LLQKISATHTLPRGGEITHYDGTVLLMVQFFSLGFVEMNIDCSELISGICYKKISATHTLPRGGEITHYDGTVLLMVQFFSLGFVEMNIDCSELISGICYK
jgi:hypothetical protein